METSEASIAAPAAEQDRNQNLIGRLDRLPFLPFHLRLITLLGSGLLFAGLDVVAIAIALPMLLAVFHLNLAVAGGLIGAVYIGQIIGSLSLGALSEIFGRKRLLLISLILFGVLSLATALAPSFQVLILLRILVGIPLGSLIPIATAYTSEYIPAVQRGRATSAALFLFTAGFLVAPFLLGFVLLPLFGQASWRVLLGLGALALLVVPFIALNVPESVRWLVHRGHVDTAEQVVERLEQQARSHQPGSELAKPSFVPMPSVVGTTKWAELFSKNYLSRTVLVWIRWFAGASILAGFASWLPSLYAFTGVGAFQIQLLNIVFAVCELIILCVYTLMVDRVGRKRWFLIGSGLSVLGAAVGGILFTLAHSTSWVVLMIAGISLSMGGYICVISNFLATAELFPTRMRSWALSTSKGIDALASIIIPIVIGALVGAKAGIGNVFLLLFILSLLAFAAEAWLGQESKLQVLEVIAR